MDRSIVTQQTNKRGAPSPAATTPHPVRSPSRKKRSGVKRTAKRRGKKKAAVPIKRNGPWSAAEDEAMFAAIRAHGHNNFDVIVTERALQRRNEDEAREVSLTLAF